MACAHTEPKTTKFDGRWEFVQVDPAPAEPMACLPKEDVFKLRELLVRCKAKLQE